MKKYKKLLTNKKGCGIYSHRGDNSINYLEANEMFYEIEINDDVQRMTIDPLEIPERKISEDWGI